jgi:hypothetical protein
MGKYKMANVMGDKIYIAHAQEDAEVAERIYDYLSRVFGRDIVYRNLSLDQLKSKMDEFKIMLVVVGRGWTELVSNPQNPMHQEIAAAVGNYRVQTIPVVIDNAQVPTKESLPKEFQAMANQQVVHIRDDASMEQNLKWVVGLLRRRPLGTRGVAFFGVVVAAMVILIVLIIAAILLA